MLNLTGIEAGFDLDDWFLDYTPHLTNCLNQKLGTSFQPADITPFPSHWQGKLDPEIVTVLWELSADPDFYLTIPPIPEAIEAAEKLRRLGVSGRLLTHRPPHTAVRTEPLIAKYLNGLITEVHYLGSGNGVPHTPKGKHAQKLGISFLVDDGAQNVESAHEYGIPAFLITKDWNYDCPTNESITRINNPLELPELVLDLFGK